MLRDSLLPPYIVFNIVILSLVSPSLYLPLIQTLIPISHFHFSQHPFFFFFFFPSRLTSICNPWGYDRPWESLHYNILPGSMPLVSLIHICCLAALSNCDFWVSLLEFTQEVFHLLGHFSEPIPTPFPLPLLFFLCLLFSKTLTRVPPLFHLLTSLPTIFSQLCNSFWQMLQAKICRCLVTREINALRVRIEKPPRRDR